ncbi:hypothetical protein B0H10DRAFT_2229483 [Mycena sp. CBHHK59/15]|nr:hypothetical protein B0H10DRAFT_2229483 [Mycena sp. CBHHK59/15]
MFKDAKKAIAPAIERILTADEIETVSAMLDILDSNVMVDASDDSGDSDSESNSLGNGSRKRGKRQKGGPKKKQHRVNIDHLRALLDKAAKQKLSKRDVASITIADAVDDEPGDDEHTLDDEPGDDEHTPEDGDDEHRVAHGRVKEVQGFRPLSKLQA